jgi:hypothetical protein
MTPDGIPGDPGRWKIGNMVLEYREADPLYSPRISFSDPRVQ